MVVNTASRRGLRQEIVVEALRRMQGDEATYASGTPLDGAQLIAQTTSLLSGAESTVLGFAPVGEDPPRFITTAVFMTLMGIGQLDCGHLEDLIRARLELSGGATDGK